MHERVWEQSRRHGVAAASGGKSDCRAARGAGRVRSFMAAGHTPIAVYAAIAGNLAIALTKFVAAAFTGSSAMLSEGIHSMVDTANGPAAAARHAPQPAAAGRADHPFGHGKELYFWTPDRRHRRSSRVGGGMSVYEGILHILHPERVEDPTWNYWVLGDRGGVRGHLLGGRAAGVPPRAGARRAFWGAVRASKDPTIFTVLFEDSAALLGMLVAFARRLLSGTGCGTPGSTGRRRSSSALLLAVVALVPGPREQEPAGRRERRPRGPRHPPAGRGRPGRAPGRRRR